MSMFMVISFNYGRFSANISYNYSDMETEFISGTYSVEKNNVELDGDDAEKLFGYVNEDDSMTVFYNGTTYTLWKQD